MLTESKTSDATGGIREALHIVLFVADDERPLPRLWPMQREFPDFHTRSKYADQSASLQLNSMRLHEAVDQAAIAS